MAHFDSPGGPAAAPPEDKPNQPEGAPKRDEGKKRPEAAPKKIRVINQAETIDRYNDRMLRGEVEFKEAAARQVSAMRRFERDPAERTRITNEVLVMASQDARREQKEKEAAGDFPALHESKLDSFKLLKTQEFFLATTGKNPVKHKADFMRFFAQVHTILPNFKDAEPEEQLRMAADFKKSTKFKGDSERMRKFMIVQSKYMEDIDQMKSCLQDAKFNEEFADEFEESGDLEAAFQEGLQKSPDKKQQYDEYCERWRNAKIHDAFDKRPKIPGGSIELPTGKQVKEAVTRYQQPGVTFEITDGSHDGVVEFGDSVYEVAFFVVDGKEPQLVIFDENADNGVRGPLVPAQVKNEFFGMSVDEFFSRKFHQFSNAGSEIDPSKLKDKDLLKIARAFLNDSEKGDLQPQQPEKILLENLAHIFIDNEATMEDKREFFKMLLRIPPTVTEAKRILRIEHWPDPQKPGEFLDKNFANFKLQLKRTVE